VILRVADEDAERGLDAAAEARAAALETSQAQAR
jgi:hypothetical protein